LPKHTFYPLTACRREEKGWRGEEQEEWRNSVDDEGLTALHLAIVFPRRGGRSQTARCRGGGIKEGEDVSRRTGPEQEKHKEKRGVPAVESRPGGGRLKKRWKRMEKWGSEETPEHVLVSAWPSLPDFPR
jgi:hypothetical protein